MNDLRLEHFMQAAEDYEGAQYRILGGLQEVRRAFSQNVIYPYLGSLIGLIQTLKTVIQQLEDVRGAQPGSIHSIDRETWQVVRTTPSFGMDQMAYVEEVIRWALPHLRSTIDEGRAVFEFVEEHLHLEEVGIMPSYVEEGYLMLPDLGEKKLHVFQYTLSVFTHTDERFRSLKTAHVKSLEQGRVGLSPQHIKLELVAENRALPNPATYCFSTDFDFPFESTVLPVAKRKLMQYLTSQSGIA